MNSLSLLHKSFCKKFHPGLVKEKLKPFAPKALTPTQWAKALNFSSSSKFRSNQELWLKVIERKWISSEEGLVISSFRYRFSKNFSTSSLTSTGLSIMTYLHLSLPMKFTLYKVVHRTANVKYFFNWSVR